MGLVKYLRMKAIGLILVQMWKRWQQVDIYRLSASLVLTTTLSLIPLFTVILGFTEFLGGMDRLVVKAEPMIFQYLAPGTAPQFIQSIQSSIDRSRGRTIGLVSILFLIYSVSRLFLEMDSAFRIVIGEEFARERGPGLALDWLILFIGPLLFAGVTFVPDWIGSTGALLVQVASALVGFSILLMIFRFSLSSRVPWGVVVKTALLCSLGILVSERVYIWCARSLFTYNEIYGSLAFLPLVLLWMLVFWNVILFSALFARVLLEQRSQRIF